MYICQLYSLITSDKFIHPCYCHPNQNIVNFHQTRKFPDTVFHWTATPTTSMTTTVLISIIITCFACSSSSSRWTLRVCTFFVPGFFCSIWPFRLVHVVARIIIHLYCWIVTNCASASQFVYLLSHWWAFGLFADFGYFQKTFLEHSCASFFMDISRSKMAESQGRYVYLYKNQPNYFKPKCLYNFTLSVAIYEGSGWATFLPMFDIDCQFNFSHSRKYVVVSPYSFK